MSPFYRAEEFNSVPALNCKTTNSVNFQRRVAPPHLLCVLYNEHYTRLHCLTLHSSILHSALCTQNTAQFALYTAQCTMHSVHSTGYSVQAAV